jgi:hypothetical protein
MTTAPLLDIIAASHSRDMSGGRDAALQLFEVYRRPWLERARAVAERLWWENPGRWLTVNDIRRECPPDEGDDPRKFGGVFNTAEWEPVPFSECGDYAPNDRSTCHKRGIRYFRKVRA